MAGLRLSKYPLQSWSANLEGARPDETAPPQI